MSKPDLPPDLTRPFTLIGNLPKELTDWFAKKGTVTIRVIRDNKVVMLFLPIKLSANKTWLSYAVPNHEIDDADIKDVTFFFTEQYDELIKKFPDKPRLPGVGDFLQLNTLHAHSLIKSRSDYKLDDIVNTTIEPGTKIMFPSDQIDKGEPKDYIDYGLAFIGSLAVVVAPLSRQQLEKLMSQLFSSFPEVRIDAHKKLTAELLRMDVSKTKPGK